MDSRSVRDAGALRRCGTLVEPERLLGRLMAARFGFSIVRDVDARSLLERAFDLRLHDRHVPLTRIEAPIPTLAGGTGFVAVTRVGPVCLRDEMVVDRWQIADDGAALVLIRKVGRILGGEITAAVAPVETGRAVLVWDQTLTVRHVPDRLVRLIAPLVGLGYRTTMARIIDGGS